MKSSKRLQDMSSGRLEGMSSRCLEEVFNVTIFRLPRRIEDVLREVLKTPEDVLEDVKLLRGRRIEDQQMFAGWMLCRKISGHFHTIFKEL